MKWIPRQYQLKGVQWLAERPKSGLLLPMGMGKTSIVLAYLSLLKQERLLSRALIIAPLRVCTAVWPVEAAKWDDFNNLKVISLAGVDDGKRDALLDEDADVYLINPESLKHVLRKDRYKKAGYNVLILDESTLFKNRDSGRFRQLAPHLMDFERRHILTGTPIPNGMIDLWAQMYMVDRGESLFKYITHYRSYYFTPGASGVVNGRPVVYDYVLKPGARERIFEAVGDKLLYMAAEDYLTLPEKIINPIYVDLPMMSRKIYEKMERDFIVSIGGEEVMSPNSAVMGMKCRQITSGFLYSSENQGQWHELHDAKKKAMSELVESLNGSPLLSFYEFQAEASYMSRFPNAVGMTEAKDVLAVTKRFNENSIPVLYAHPRSGGHGLNLQEGSCRNILFSTPIWDIELFDQACARVWRSGNKADSVVINVIVARGTLDEVVLAAMQGKDRTQKAFLRLLKDYHAR